MKVESTYRDRKQITVDVDKLLFAQAKYEATIKDVYVYEIIEKALESYFNEGIKEQENKANKSVKTSTNNNRGSNAKRKKAERS